MRTPPRPPRTGLSKQYHDYIASLRWKIKRTQALNHYGRRCIKCGGSKRLEVHHLNYRNFGNERMEDLEVMCHACHRTLHKKKDQRKGKPTWPLT